MNTSHARVRLFALALAAALSLGACGSASDSGDAAAELPTLSAADDTSSDSGDSDGDGTELDNADAEQVDPELVMADYEKCLADLGVDVDFAGAGGASIESFETDEEDDATGTPNLEDFEAAAEQCDSILDDAFGDFDLTPEQEAEQADQMLVYERCMADAGFDIDTSGGVMELDADIDFEAFEAANESCAQSFGELSGSDR